MKRPGRRGSLTIFFCLVMSALLLVYSILIQAAQTRAAENDLSRSLTAQIQASLAAFDQDWQEFGLFGYLAAAADPNIFTASLPLSLRACPIRMETLNPLSDPNVLAPQIIRYMKSRVPAVYLDLLISKLSGLRHIIAAGQPEGTVVSQARARAAAERVQAVPAGFVRTGTDEAVQDLSSLITPFIESVSDDDVQAAADSIFGDLISRVQDEAILQLQAIYNQYAAQVLGVESDNMTSVWLGQIPDFLNPGAISRLAGHLDQLLAFPTAPIYEKCCLVEYILGQFRPDVQKMRLASGVKNIETLSGKPFVNLPDSRDSEVELILTGFDETGPARLAVQAILTSLRCLIRLAAILADQSGMRSLQAAASGLSAGIAALTAGTVIIDPKIMVYLVAVGQAIGEGLADCRELLDGGGVEFWPGKSPVNVTLFYQDYLRLFLLVVPQAALLSRTAEQLGQILPGPCFTSLQASTEYRQHMISRVGGYQS